MQVFLSIPLMSNWILAGFSSALVALVCVVLLQRLRHRAWLWITVGLLAGATFGALTTWLLGDVLRVFGEFALTPAMIMWVATGTGVAGAAIAAIASPHRSRRWWHHVTASMLVVLAIATAALGVNRAVGYFQTPGQILSLFTQTSLPAMPTLDVKNAMYWSYETWSPPADMPTDGVLVQETIPGTVSGFEARPAVIYLPPAALTSHPPRLPMIVAFSGQPGSPIDVFQSGHVEELAEEYQKTHHGIAPIIVAPDQLGNMEANPMCLNSQLGQNETYLMTDVFSWIDSQLPVQTDAAHTAFLGFSQGATCTIQLGFAHPDVVDTLVPISAQLEPTIGSHTVDSAFGGDEAAYKANTPLEILARHGPYESLRASFYVGSTDTKYTAWAHTLVDAAKAEGVDATLTFSPGTGHNWHTAAYGMKHSFPFLISRLGLPQ